MATTNEIVTAYKDLLIAQYKSKTKARATIDALVRALVADQIYLSVLNGFNLDTAVGAQLDIIGQYAGQSRRGYNFDGPVELDDDDYRLILKLKVFQNRMDGSMYAIQTMIDTFFDGILLAFDHQDMSLTYYMDSGAGGSQDLAEFFVMAGSLPRPTGVRLRGLVYATPIDTFFAFRTYDNAAVNSSPFNNYTVYDETSPWLTYDDVLTPP